MLDFTKTILNALKMYINEKFVSSKPDWNQNDASAENYIKNKPFYEKNEEVLLVNNLTSEDYNNEDVENPKCTFVLGNTYKVIWNDVVYDNLVCHLEDDEWRVIACSDNGCPFYIDDDGGDALYIGSDNEDEAWTVSIIEYRKELKKIDKKYLPDDIGLQPDWNQNDETAKDYIKNKPFGIEIGKKYLIEEQVITLDDSGYGNCTPIQDWFDYLPVGTPYEIEFDGEIYTGTAYEDGDACIRTDFTTSNDVKVYFYDLTSISSSSELEGAHTIKLSVIGEVVKQLDEKYLPEINVENFVKPLPIYRRDYYPSDSVDDHLVNILELEHGYTYGLIPGDNASCGISSITLTIVCDNGDIKMLGYMSTNDLVQVFKLNGRIELRLKNRLIYVNILDTSSEDSVVIEYKRCNAEYLGIDNYEEYIPRNSYNPATKKYVDDSSNAILTGKQTFNHFVMKDTVTGYNYIVEMNNGQLISYCADVVGISVVNPPNKTEYLSGDTFDPTGMVVVAECADGTSREITDYNYSETVSGNNTITITYKDVSTEVEITNITNLLRDFNYTSNNDGTYTLTGWKGTLNGVPSTECVIPDSDKIIL